MVKKQKHEHLDEQLFRQEMAGVVPLKIAPITDSKVPRTQNTGDEVRGFAVESDLVTLSPSGEQTHIDSEDGSSLRKNGVQKRTMQKLKRGRFKVGAELDLHNMTMETAYSVLLEFVADAQSGSLDSIRIIHGKGLRSENGPKLKMMTRQVLRDHPHVLAYTACKPADGGSGAVDVLLKTS